MTNIICYPQGSAAYNRALEATQDAAQTQNRRNRFTVSVKKGTDNPFGHVPSKPSKAQLKVIRADRNWKDELKDRPDHWWFERINAAIEENFYRAKVYCLVWWELCDNEQQMDHGEWKAQFEGYDFERDLECDWELVEYALHCVGFPPLKAHQMAFEASDRQKWKAHRKLVFKCFECDAERTQLNYPPIRCTTCGKTGTMEQL
jgi:hypothetical protein